MRDTTLRDIRRVVAIVEPGSETQPAIERLNYLAKSMEFDVMLIACDYSQYLVEGYYFFAAELPTLRQEYLDERKILLEALAEPLRTGGLSVATQAIKIIVSNDSIIFSGLQSFFQVMATGARGRLHHALTCLR
jgi:hypothetical protein